MEAALSWSSLEAVASQQLAPAVHLRALPEPENEAATSASSH